MAEKYIRNLTYPQGYERSETAINRYYNARALELEAQYESRVREVDRKIYDYAEGDKGLATYSEQNEELFAEQKKLLEEYERASEGITALEQQAEVKRSRYNALENLWYQTEDATERDRIKAEAVKTAQELDEIEGTIKTVQEQNRTVKQRYWDDTKLIQDKILANNRKMQELEGKQDELYNRKGALEQQLSADLEKNESAREKALTKINVKVKNIKIKKHASGPVSKDRKRIVVVPFTISIDYPEGENPSEIPDDVLMELGIEACDLVGAEYVTPNPSEMKITDSAPSGGGLDIYDYEQSGYASDFTSISVFFDYGIYLDYIRLPDGENYAPPKD